MPEALTNEPFPLETSADGVIRVRGTRVTLDTVWAAFNEGATADEIVQQYPSLSLADAYQAIGYCLRNPTLLITYLAKRSEIAAEARKSNELRWPPEGSAPDCWHGGPNNRVCDGWPTRISITTFSERCSAQIAILISCERRTSG
jgi:uncharacterized protein (DUF433 family)